MRHQEVLRVSVAAIAINCHQGIVQDAKADDPTNQSEVDLSSSCCTMSVKLNSLPGLKLGRLFAHTSRTKLLLPASQAFTPYLLPWTVVSPLG